MIKVINKHAADRTVDSLTGTYIGRPSPLGNPFIIGKDGDRTEVISKYKRWLLLQLARPSKAKDELNRLIELYNERKELVLICWCAPAPCHGDVIREFILAYTAEEETS